MKETEIMTPAQREAMDKAVDILREHFDRAAVAVEYDGEDDDSYGREVAYHGGLSSAIGLLELAKDMLINPRIEVEIDADDEEDD